MFEVPGNNNDIRDRIRQLDRRMGRRRAMPLCVDTIGVELESIGLSRDTLSTILYENTVLRKFSDHVKITRDASGEANFYLYSHGRRVFQINSHNVEAQKIFNSKLRKYTYGYELVTNPLQEDVMSLLIDLLLPALESNGDFVSERCATHVHIGMNKNIDILKSALMFGLWADDLFYSIAGMGDTYRGFSNNSIYSRPLISGPFFPRKGDFFQILNWKKALQATDVYDFFYCYHVNLEEEIMKYHPARYFGLNLYSIIHHGTLEFRYFNQSLDPLIVNSVINLCQVSAEIVYKGNTSSFKTLPIGDPFNYMGPSYYKDKLRMISKLSQELRCNHLLSEDSFNCLAEVIETSPPFTVGRKEVLTHVRDFNPNTGLIKYGDLQKSEGVPVISGNVDIHNINIQPILSLDGKVK